jgi:glycosyltransferase involved in cell wall biosynthesis
MLTVFLTTHDGADTLPEVLGAWERVEAPAGGWRFLVADDGSADASSALLARAAERLPLVLVRTPHRGQNASRNAAIHEVRGDLVVFTDDDAVPRPDVLVRLREAADRHPEAVVFAGRIVPRWRATPPDWVLRWVRLAPTYAVREDVREGPISADEALGPCLAVRAAVFEEGQRFEESFGPDGTTDYAMGSETSLLLGLARRGAVARAVPDAVVEHVILPEQLEEAWILARAERFGRGRWRLDETYGAGGAPGGLPHLLAVARERLRLAFAFGSRGARRRFKARWRLRYLRGEARERALVRALAREEARAAVSARRRARVPSRAPAAAAAALPAAPPRT